MLSAIRKLITILLVALSVFTVNVANGQDQSRQIYPLPVTFQMDETVDQHGSQTVYRTSQYQAQRRVSEKPDFFVSFLPADVQVEKCHYWFLTSIQPAGPPHFASRAPPVQLV